MSLEPGPLLEGKIAVVTGAGEGTGRGIAEAFGAHGATVVIADRDGHRLGQTADDIANRGGKVIPVLADVSRPADVRRVADLAGEVDILVNHAGADSLSTPGFLESGEADWLAAYERALKPVFLCCRAMVPGMVVRDRGGSVINIAADRLGAAVYAGFRAGVTGFTRSLAVELGPHRIRVNLIRTPAGPSREHDDVAGVALFLASDLAANVSGTAIPADGPTLVEG
jgi:NAD(P)-dependent dehydrogenase (short-subunit alcohol dehydrogenase family)